MSVKQKVTFELLQPLMCGGIRVADNFLESESFVRGSVLRAAFANRILLECPLADQVTPDGKHNFITLKDPDGRCQNCPHRAVCAAFGSMTFSFAYPMDSIPAPLTAKVCKKCGTSHPIKDVLVQEGALRCNLHGEDAAASRMESLKGLIRMEGETIERVHVPMTLSTHTAIHYSSHTADDGSLYSVNAVRKGQTFTAIIDDCDTDLLRIGDLLYVGKYASCGFGKMRITALQPVRDVSAEEIAARIAAYNHRFASERLVSLLLLSDACPLEVPVSDMVLTNEAYLQHWTQALFGTDALPFTLEKIFTEVQLYSGFDTASSWKNWKKKQPQLQLLKGTSLLLRVKDGCMEEAVDLLTAWQRTGIGKQTENGFGQIAVCHPIHCIGVNDHA